MTEPEPGRRPATRGAALLIALSVLVVVLVAALVPLATGERSAARKADDEQALLAVARQAVTNLLTVDRADPKGSVQRLAGSATGPFRQQLDEMTDGFAQSLKDSQASSTGEVREAGVRAASTDQASVLVSATALVRNTALPQGDSVQYRLVVGLQRTDAGWMVASMEFMP